MSDARGTVVSINAVGNKTKFYADKVYLYGLVFFLASQACIFTNSVPVLFYYLLFYTGAVLLAAVGIYRIFFAFLEDRKKAIPAVGVLLFFALYFVCSAKTSGIADALPFLVMGFAAAGAIGVNADHVLITGIIGNLVMILNNAYMSFVRADDRVQNLYTFNDFFYFGDDQFYFHRMNNRSSTDWAAHYFWMIAAYFWIRGRKITWGELLAAGALDILVYSLTGSNTSLICISMILVIAVIYKLHLTLGKRPGNDAAAAPGKNAPALLRAGKKIIEFCAKYSFVIFAALMILLTALYNTGDPLFYRLNILLHQRLALGLRGFIEQGIHLISSGVPIYGNLSNIDNFYNFLDSSYISILVKMGLIPFFFYLAGMTAVQLRHKKYLYGALILAVCALSCVEEHHLAEIPYNFFILMLFADLDKTKTDDIAPAPVKKKKTNVLLDLVPYAVCAVFLAAAVSVIYPRYKAVKECDRLDMKASVIYESVQKNLDDSVKSGQWQLQTSRMNSDQYGDMICDQPYDFLLVTGKTWSEMKKDPKAHSYYSVSYDAGDGAGSFDVLEILISDETKDLIGDGSAVIEYDVAEGKVYSVWYSEQSGCHSIAGGRLSDRLDRLSVKEGMEGYSTGGYNG